MVILIRYTFPTVELLAHQLVFALRAKLAVSWGNPA